MVEFDMSGVNKILEQYREAGAFDRKTREITIKVEDWERVIFDSKKGAMIVEVDFNGLQKR